MDFNDWWNGPSGFGNFTIKELAEDVGVPVKFKDYVEDLSEAFYAGKPKPSTDFTTPFDNPGKDYLMYEKGIGWVVGWTSEMNMSKHYYCHIDEGIVEFWPSHWFPMPDAPDT